MAKNIVSLQHNREQEIGATGERQEGEGRGPVKLIRWKSRRWVTEPVTATKQMHEKTQCADIVFESYNNIVRQQT